MKIMRKASHIFFLAIIILLYGRDISAQVNVSGNIREKFIRYCSELPREEIFVHTDRISYIAGEDIWFKVYLFDRVSARLSDISTIAYFELLSYDNRPVIRKRIRISGGTGPGQVNLPDTLSQGIYSLKVYTNWMRNFMPGNCYSQEIGIYNAVDNQKPVRKPVKGKDDKAGKSGYTSADEGFGLKVVNHDPDDPEIIINAEKRYRSENNSSCNLFIHTHGIVNFFGEVRLTGDETKWTISRGSLSPGINHITLFDSKGWPLAERFIYTSDKKNVKPVIECPEEVNSRERIPLNIRGINEEKGELSISVRLFSAQDSSEAIDDYMVFGSEFGTDILKKLGGKKLNELPSALTDSLLLNVKSNWIDWKTILSDKYPKPLFAAENAQHFLKGKLIGTNESDIVNGKKIILSIPGKEAVFQYAVTDGNGNFTFELPVDEEQRDIIIQPDDINDKSILNIESSFSGDYSTGFSSPDTAAASIPSLIPGMSVNYQVNKIYGLQFSKPGLPLPITYRPKRFYGKPDIELVLDNYIKLPVMQEIFFELMPGVFLKKRKSQYVISMVDPINDSYLKEPPVLFIDGVRISDAGQIVNLDPEYVERIDAVKVKYLVGDYLFHGLINVITKSADFSKTELPGYAVRMLYRAVENVNTFFYPEYPTTSSMSSRIPDFRNTLYWNPEVSKNIEFWSSDYSSDYEINIEGVLNNGQLISIKKLLKIR